MHQPSTRVSRGIAVAVCLFVCACGGSSTPTGPTTPAATVPESPAAPAPAPPERVPVPDATLAGAGDIVKCTAPEAELTARLLDRIPGSVFSLGDNVYPNATAALLAQCYTPTWGRHLSRTIAVPGNHEWEVSNGAPFFAYFGAAAGPAGLGYFSTTVGAWHVIGLNSNVAASPGSPQYE